MHPSRRTTMSVSSGFCRTTIAAIDYAAVFVDTVRMQKLEHAMSARRDFRLYFMLLVGVVFVYAGATVDPATNCDESGRECAPWLVPIAFALGVLLTASALLLFALNRKWGTRLDPARRQLVWWDDGMSPASSVISIDDVATIKVQHFSDSQDRLFLYDRNREPIRFPQEHAVPWDSEKWARQLAAAFPHIVVEVEDR